MLVSVANRALTNLSEPNTLDSFAEQETEQAAAGKPLGLKRRSPQTTEAQGAVSHAPRIPHFQNDVHQRQLLSQAALRARYVPWVPLHEPALQRSSRGLRARRLATADLAPGKSATRKMRRLRAE